MPSKISNKRDNFQKYSNGFDWDRTAFDRKKNSNRKLEN